jgi:hypothetical protein
MSYIPCYFANFTSANIEAAAADSTGNAGTISRGADWDQQSLVAPGFVIPANSISPVLGQVAGSGWWSQHWDWLYFNVLNADGSIEYQLQSYLYIAAQDVVTLVEVGAYSASTSNDNPMPAGVYRGHGAGSPDGIYFVLLDTDLPQ